MMAESGSTSRQQLMLQTFEGYRAELDAYVRDWSHLPL
jgi:hypothetical protein